MVPNGRATSAFRGALLSLSMALMILATSTLNTTGLDLSVRFDSCFDSTFPARCANLSVPVDWDRPDGAVFNLFITVLPAGNKSARIGNLFFNPGGPGDPPSRLLAPDRNDLDFWGSSRITEVLDFIAIDTRGTGISNPVLCDPEVWNIATKVYAQTEEEFDLFVANAQESAESCFNRTGDFLRYVDTASAAKDMEAVRIALGDEPLTYYGQSYGTESGATYAELFPDNIRAMVLDSVLDHSWTDSWKASEDESRSFERSIGNFFEWCKSAGATCVLHEQDDLPAWFDALIDSVEESPIEYHLLPAQCPKGDCSGTKGKVTGRDMLVTVQQLLKSANGWFSSGSGPNFQNLAVELLIAATYRLPGPFRDRPLEINADNSSSAFSYSAIMCADWAANQPKLDYAAFKAKMDEGAAKFPHTMGVNGVVYNEVMCSRWPVPPTNPPHEIKTFQNPARKPLDPPILLVNSYYDPATAYEWALSLQRQLGHANSILLRSENAGHVDAEFPGAVTDAVWDYLANLKLPAPGTVLKNSGLR